MNELRVSLDAMGGDFGPDINIAAAKSSLAEHPELNLVLVGKEDILRPIVNAAGMKDHPRLSIHHASEIVSMKEAPAQALRKKKDSSMRVAIDLVKSGAVNACVSAGNTGALMATARFVLKTLPGIDRPAIMTALPTMYGHTHVLDLGANVDCTEAQLFQFAIMGSALKAAITNNQKPTVALLNIGIEDIKGNERVRATAKMLKESNSINYIGYIEGDDIFHRPVDVIVCDGFVGNIALKSGEGVSNLLLKKIRLAFTKNWYTKLIALFAKPILRTVTTELDPRHHNGASLVGLRGIVIKSHGGADTLALSRAINEAVIEVQKDLPQRIQEHVAAAMKQEAVVI